MDIKSLRISKNWSQEKLAEITGLSTRTIQRIEKDGKASEDSIKLLADAFKISKDELLNSKESIDKQVFYKDEKLIVFVIINIMLFTINMLTSPDYLWFIYPLVGWGIPFFLKRRLKISPIKYA